MKYRNREFIKYLPIYIAMILIFKFFYDGNGVSKIIGIFVPVFAGIFIAVIINPVMSFLENNIFKSKYPS